MSRQRYPGFCGPSYTAQSPLSDVEQCVNLFVESNKASDAKSPYSLLPTPGLSQLGTAASSGVGRGIFTNNNRSFVVIGTIFYEVNADFSLTNRGTVATNANPSTMCANLDGQVFITSGSNGYLFDTATNVFTAIGNLVGKADQGAHLDGFFLALQFSTSTVFISEVDDGLTWDPTQFFQRSAFPDPWRSMVVTPVGQIFLLGDETSELWGDVGSSPIPFALISGAKFKQGIAAPFSCCSAGTSMIWLAKNKDGQRTVQKLNGYSTAPVSTPPIEWAFRQYSDVSDTQPFIYDLEGHIHYVLNSTKANVSWGFDVTEDMWHQRGTWNSATGRQDVWRPQAHAMVNGRHVVTDSQSGLLYEMNTDNLLDAAGMPIRRLRVPPAISMMKRMVYYGDLEIYLEPGLAPRTGQGSSGPIVWLEESKNGGKTWGRRRQRTAGLTGQYGWRTRWGTMGAARDKGIRISMSDPAPWRITDAYIDIEPGTN